MSARKRRIKRKIAMLVRMDRQYLLSSGDRRQVQLANMLAISERLKRGGHVQKAIDAMKAERHKRRRHW